MAPAELQVLTSPECSTDLLDFLMQSSKELYDHSKEQGGLGH